MEKSSNFKYEIKKGDKILVKGIGYDEDLKDTVQLSITIEESTYREIEKRADYYKYSTFEVISHLLSYNLEERIEEYNYMINFPDR